MSRKNKNSAAEGVIYDNWMRTLRERVAREKRLMEANNGSESIVQSRKPKCELVGILYSSTFIGRSGNCDHYQIDAKLALNNSFQTLLHPVFLGRIPVSSGIANLGYGRKIKITIEGIE